eukprot:608122-Rhodomonas_salina.1
MAAMAMAVRRGWAAWEIRSLGVVKRGFRPRYSRSTFWLTLLLVCALFAQSAVSVEQQEKPQDITPPEGAEAPKQEGDGKAETAPADAKPAGEEKGTLGDVTPEELAKAGEASAKAKVDREKDAEERRAFREAKEKQEAEEEAAREAELQKIPVTYGSVILVRHDPTKKFLAATNFKYFHPHSSNQHQIIVADQEDGYTHWRVTPRAGNLRYLPLSRACCAIFGTEPACASTRATLGVGQGHACEER